jgi:glyoxylase-like metal-dependent hydrolase (beta-lactamase superfamily II)
VWAHTRTAPLVASYPWSTPPVVAANVDFFLQNGAPADVAQRVGEFLAGAVELQQGVVVDQPVEHGARLPTLGEHGLELFEVAGHYPGHIVLYDAESRELIGGDHLLDDGTTVPFLFLKDWDQGIRPRSLILFLESLEHVARLDIDRVFPGHGSFELPHRLWIERIRKHHARIRGRVRHHLEKGPATVYEIARRLYRAQLDAYTFLVFSEVVGNLDLLERDGEVESFTADDGLTRYRATSAERRRALVPSLRLDRDGRWFDGADEITHAGTVEMLLRGLTRDGDAGGDGGFVVVIGMERRAVEVEDAPYVVQRVEHQGERLLLGLGAGLVEPLDPTTLVIGADHVIYARVRDGLRARFSRAAYYQLASRIEENPAGGFVLVMPDGTRHALGAVPGPD